MQLSIRACMQSYVRVHATMHVLAVLKFAPRLQWRAPWSAKCCLAAYTAAMAVHLLRRPRVSLAYSVLLQAEQSMTCRQVGITAV